MSTMGYVSTLPDAGDTSTLSLDFEKQIYKVMEGGRLVSKKFSDLFSFARTTTGGRFNEKGLYENMAAGQPRFDYDPITRVLKGLLVEEQRTNLVPFSDDLRLWNRTRIDVIPNSTTSPDGKFKGTKIVSSTTADWHYASSPSFSVPTSTSYTQTVYAKAGEWPRIRLGFMDTNVFTGATVFDLTTGTRVSGSSGDISPVGGGWYRCSLTNTSKIAGSSGMSVNPVKAGEVDANSAGDGVSGIYVWGAQVEQAAFHTSYIPTSEDFASRASSATYFDKQGVLRVADVNVPRGDSYLHDNEGALKPVGLMVEVAATNRIPRTGETMRIAPWSAAGVTMSFETGLDGGLTATKMTENSVSSVKELRQQLTIPVTVGAACTLSVYAKPSGNDRQLRVGFGSNGPVTGTAQAVFNLASRTVATVDNVTYSIQKLPGGWARYSITVIPTNAVSASFYFTLLVGGGAGYAGDGASGCVLYGPQIESGSVATSYIRSAGTFTSRASTATYIDSKGVIQSAANNVGRDQAYGYDAMGTLRPIGLLVEGNATNLLANSHDFTTGWSNTGPGLPFVITPNAADGTRGPGTMTLLKRTDLAVRYLTKNLSGAASAGTTITLSQRVKVTPNAQSWLAIRIQCSYSNRVDIRFNPTTGECSGTKTGDTTMGTVSMTKEAGGVWLCSATATSGAEAWSNIIVAPQDRSAAVDGTPAALSEVYVDTVQIEIGATATSYIPTTSTAVTRAADVYNSTTSTRASDVTSSAAATRVNDSAPILDLTTWYNQSASTFKVEFTPGEIGIGSTNLAFYTRSAAAIANSLVIIRRGPAKTNSVGIISRPDGSVQMDSRVDIAGTPGERIKSCIAYKLNNAAFATQGKAPVLDNTVELPTPEWLFVGNNGSNSQNLNGHIHSLLYFPVRLSNDQTQLLTS